MTDTNPTDPYRSLREGAGLVNLARRTQIELVGGDAAQFLHNLSTNDVCRLAPGEGCETFLATAQGRIVGHVFLFRGRSSIVLTSVPGEAETILAHLDHYRIREEVELIDRGGDWSCLLVAGPESPRLLADRCETPVPTDRLSHVRTRIEGVAASVRRTDLVGDPGFCLQSDADQEGAILDILSGAGAVVCGAAAFEAARIESGMPWFGRDITSKTLPQEVGRNAQAISFQKGCYLGQETVARIDALGHVNRRLAGVLFSGTQIPPPGTELLAGGDGVGHVTSSAWSPRLGGPLAMALIAVRCLEPGTSLRSAVGEARVVRLPVV